LLIFQFQIFL